MADQHEKNYKLGGTLGDAIMEIAMGKHKQQRNVKAKSSSNSNPLDFYFEYCTNCIDHDWHTHHELNRYENYAKIV